MRTIKFRCWNFEENKMEFPDLSDGWVMCEGEINHRNAPLYPLMQFIGLHDKNGREIFVGDVLQLKKLDGSVLLYKIFCVKGGFAFNTHQDDFYKPQSEIYFYESTSDMQNSSFISTLEIIGNIYEHRELLTD